ncbi:MAG TPA: arylamine N-acetyltransferase [Streptosporangiaceae bacterium]|jgi:N-hydroxyarylamine O-acetyltransferase
MSDWHPERLDLDAYLARVGYTGPREPTAAALRALHRAHTEAIPFENLDIVLGREISVDLDDLQDKIVRRGRGGYCLEHAALFGAVLDRLGFPVVRLNARIAAADASKIRPRTHALLRVGTDGGPWIADVGFGFGVPEPVPLADGAVSEQGPWAYRIERYGPGWRLLSREADGTWSPLHTFIEDPQHWVDYFTTNYFVSTHATSPFVGHAVAMRTTDAARTRLRGRELTTIAPDGRTDVRALDDDSLVAVLRGTFGIALPDDDAKALVTAVR